MKKRSFFLSISTFLLASGLTAGAFVGAHATKEIKKATAEEEVVTKYLPMNSTNFYTCFEDGDNFDNKSIEELTSPRMDTFHDGLRTYGALDNFLNTMARGSGEGRVGSIRSVRWVHKGGYVSFLLGGNGNNFVNIWDETQPHNVVNEARNEFYSSRGDAFDNGYRNGTNPAFELSGNMALKYYYIPDELIGHELIAYIRDNTTGYYGGVTFGDLRVNQTLEEVARTFATHKQQMIYDAKLSTQNSWARDYLLNTYYKTEYYAPLVTAEAALSDANEGFETYALTNWAFDKQFSTADINFGGIVSNNDAKDWVERMPANKSDNFYVNADVSGIAEAEKYRLVSPEFTLSGNGFISAKLGGATAVLSLIDETGAELVTSRIAAAEGENNLNGGFRDNGGVANVMASGSRYNTMTRTYLDASAHLGKKVRVTLSDDRTGGAWGLAYFDEVITKYDSLPTLKVDRIEQQFNDTPLYHGVVTDRYIGSETTTFGKAYNFVQRYYSLMRNQENGNTWCSLLNNNDVKQLLSDYADLEADVKALVDAAQDFDFGKSATKDNFYLTNANLDYTVGQSIAFATSSAGQLEGIRAFAGFDGLDFSVTGILILTICAAFIVAIVFVKRKKIKNNY